MYRNFYFHHEKSRSLVPWLRVTNVTASPPPPLTHGNRERVFSRVSDSTRGVIAGECLHITEHNR